MENHSRRAVDAVIEMRDWLEQANQRWSASERPQLPTRFGLAAGMVTVGNIGAEKRLSYTALGDTVNLACRLEEMNSILGTTILTNRNVHEAAGDDFEWRKPDPVEVRGKRKLVEVYELVGRRSRVDG
ncbi:MAG: adenylate/guanylate cyclase domain-containing protein [Akkermansiaceae bacterium]